MTSNLDPTMTTAMILNHIRGVVTALDAVAAQMPVPDQGLGTAARRIEDLADDLIDLSVDLIPDLTVSPSLPPLWHPKAFDVTSSRPRVLMTVGLNALQVLIRMYEDVLESNGPDQFLTIATNHRQLVASLYAELADADWWAVSGSERIEQAV